MTSKHLGKSILRKKRYVTFKIISEGRGQELDKLYATSETRHSVLVIWGRLL